VEGLRYVELVEVCFDGVRFFGVVDMELEMAETSSTRESVVRVRRREYWVGALSACRPVGSQLECVV
jgi:hypothetical protein